MLDRRPSGEHRGFAAGFYGFAHANRRALVAALQAAGAGGMLYLTVSALVPPSEGQQ